MTEDVTAPWRAAAVCDGAGYIDWTAERPTPETLKFARELCSFCEVSDACLRDAVADRESSGIRAGTTERERRRLRPPTAWDNCGDVGGLRRHYDNAETPCGPCRVFQAARDATWKRAS